MAKIKKRKLKWTASESAQVVGYKLYWAEGGEHVGYDSPCAKMGNVTEVVLPDDVAAFAPESSPVEFGIAAVDELGNESDLITVSAPYQFNVPHAPDELWIEGLEKTDAQEEETAPEPPSEPIALREHSAMDVDTANAHGLMGSSTDDGDAPDPAQHFGRR